MIHHRLIRVCSFQLKPKPSLLPCAIMSFNPIPSHSIQCHLIQSNSIISFNPMPSHRIQNRHFLCCLRVIRAFAEMVERKIRQETGIKFIDILFLHSPQHISMTLNDLFERLVTRRRVLDSLHSLSLSHSTLFLSLSLSEKFKRVTSCSSERVRA